ncbi:hypothetical protein J6590_027182 [Homalodisca vitripennis]|nr:hypothetical protein J6590_027182 [Homalodisca vitripennis]
MSDFGSELGIAQELSTEHLCHDCAVGRDVHGRNHKNSSWTYKAKTVTAVRNITIAVAGGLIGARCALLTSNEVWPQINPTNGRRTDITLFPASLIVFDSPRTFRNPKISPVSLMERGIRLKTNFHPVSSVESISREADRRVARDQRRGARAHCRPRPRTDFG